MQRRGPRRGRWGIMGACVVAVIALVVCSRAWWESHTRWRMVEQGADTSSAFVGVVAFTERAQRDVQIGVWQQALDADPHSAIALGQLAALHAQRAREGGGESDYTMAEGLARRSLQERTQRNGATAVTLVSVLLAQHRYSEAYREAQTLWSRESDIPQYRALLGEVAMEIGDYATARSAFAMSLASKNQLSTAPRLARWLELNGRTAKARQILQAARDEALARGEVSREAKAWYCLRVGDVELRAGRSREAAAAFRAGLRIEPGDPRLHAAMARGAAAAGQWRDAIAWGERAVAEQMDVATLTVVADAYRAIGDTAQSAAYTRAVDVTLQAMTGPPHRMGALYLLDHEVRVAEILAVAEAQLRTRSDVYGYDLAAWAAYRAGQPVRAAAHMQRALALHTNDPMLIGHAQAIARALDAGPLKDQQRALALSLQQAIQGTGA